MSKVIGDDLDATQQAEANLLLTHNPFVYKGYFYDDETGYYYLKSRYYDPRIHRFLSADKIDYLDPQSLSSLNLYVYCGDNPVMGYDPSGKKWYDWITMGLVVVGTVALTVGVVAFTVATFGVGAVVAAAISGAIFGGIYGGISSASNGQTGWDIVAGIAMGAISGAIMGVGSLAGPGYAFLTGFAVGFTTDSISQFYDKGTVNYLKSGVAGLEIGILNTLTYHSIPGNIKSFGVHFAANSLVNSVASLYGLGFDKAYKPRIDKWLDDVWSNWTGHKNGASLPLAYVH